MRSLSSKASGCIFPRKLLATPSVSPQVQKNPLRKVLHNHRSFPTDESALKVVYLAITNIAKRWTMPIRDWKRALNRFAIEFEGRFPME
jgi:transposase-like protein